MLPSLLVFNKCRGKKGFYSKFSIVKISDVSSFGKNNFQVTDQRWIPDLPQIV